MSGNLAASQGVKSAVVYGGTPMSTDKEMLKDWPVDPDDEYMNATSSPEFPHFQNMYALGQCPCSTKTQKKLGLSSDMKFIFIWSINRELWLHFEVLCPLFNFDIYLI